MDCEDHGRWAEMCEVFLKLTLKLEFYYLN